MEYSYNKKSIWKWILLYILLGAIAYGLVYYFFFAKNRGYKYNQDTEYNNQTSQGNETANWKTYKNSDLGFLIKYPNDFAPSLELNDQYNKLVIFKKPGSKEYFQVRLFRDEEDAKNYLDNNDSNIIYNDVKINGISWFRMSNELGPEGPDPFVKFGAEHNGIGYTVIFNGDTKISQEEQEILSTFKFTK